MPRKPRRQINLPKISIPALGRLRAKLPQIKTPNWGGLGRQVLVVAVVVVLVWVMTNLNSRLSEYYRLGSERDRLGTEVAQLNVTHQVLVTQMAYAQSDQAAEDFARNAHMIREGENLVVPLTPAANPTPTPAATEAAVRPMDNWEIWWALFFEE